MKNKIFSASWMRLSLLLLILFFFCVQNLNLSYAVAGIADTSVVHDPINAALNSAKAAADKIYQAFMTNKTVIMAKTIYDNYVTSKNYYDMVERLSKHEGGFLGYLKDYSLQQAMRVAQQEKSMVMDLKYGSRNTYLEEKIKGLSGKLTEELTWKDKSYDQFENYTLTTVAESEKRDQEVQKTIHDADRPMDSKKMEEVKVKLLILQTQSLRAIESMQRASLTQELRRQKEEIRRQKEEVLETQGQLAYLKDQLDRITTTRGKNPYEVLREKPQ